MAFARRFAHQFEQMMIVNCLDLIGQDHETDDRFHRARDAQSDSQAVRNAGSSAWRPECLPSTSFESGTPTDCGVMISYVRRILQHAVLVNAGFVRESVAPDDGLIRLHRNAGDLLQHLAGGIQLLAWRCWSGTDSDQRALAAPSRFPRVKRCLHVRRCH